MSELTQKGISLLKSGDRATARRLLDEAIQQNPNDSQAWLWRSGAVDTDVEREKCLRKVLEIDPKNQAALRGLEKILHTIKPVETEPRAPELRKSIPDIAVQQEIEPQTPAEYCVKAEDLTEPGSPTPSLHDLYQSIPNNTIQQTSENHSRVIFHARPSVVPPLLAFWFFLAGAVGINAIQQDAVELVDYAFPIGLGIFLETIVLIVLVKSLRTKFILTNQYLSVPFNKKKVTIPSSEIFHAEMAQTIFQRLLNTGDLYINTAIGQRLIWIKLRDVSECKRRLEQINSFIQ